MPYPPRGMQLRTTLEGRVEEQEVLQAFRSACWDLYVSNLPDPIIAEAAALYGVTDLQPIIKEFNDIVSRYKGRWKD